MLKRIIVILILFLGMSAFAAENYLNSVVIETQDGNKTVILRSDFVAKVKKDIQGQNKLILTLKGIKQSADIDTLYKNTPDIDGLVIQKENNNELKIYIESPDISKANIVFETPDSAPITVSDNNAEGKTLWSIISIAILLAVMHSAKNISSEQPTKDMNEVLKEREKELYKNFQKEVATLPSMNYKLKSYRKHVLKGETIRSYESRISRV